MKHFIFFLFFTTTFFAQVYYPLDRTPISSTSGYTATTYYVSSTGNDANNGTSENSAWQSLIKVNSFTPLPGDRILFKRGDKWTGTINVNASGIAGRPITFGAYGKGANPIITGFKELSSWIDDGGGIYYTTLNVPRLNIVTLDHNVVWMGRYPDSGYLNYESHNAKTSITDNQLTGTPDWTGAEIGIRKYRWIIDRHIVTSQAGGTLTYSSDQSYGNATMYEPMDKNGYFFQNDLKCIDDLGDWCYNVSEKRIYMNFGGNLPDDYVIKAGNADRNLTVNSQSYNSFENIDFEGANLNGIYLVSCNHINITNCNIINQGGNGIYGISSDYISITGGSIIHSLNNAVFFEDKVNNATIDGITLTNAGKVLGAGRSGDGNENGIAVNGDNLIVKNCNISNIGYNGITFDGDDALIENNLIDTFCTIKDDGGGIYTYLGLRATIQNNIVLNAAGSYDGAGWSYWEPYGKAAGIYLDNGVTAHNAIVTGNSISTGGWIGIFINNNGGNTITDNTVSDYLYQLFITNYDLGNIRNLTVRGNKLIAKSANQLAFFNDSYINESPLLYGTIDSNYFARPIDDNLTINSTIDGTTIKNKTLLSWQSYSGQDGNSKKSPIAITNVNDLQFAYNETSSPKVVLLNYPSIDVKGKKYTGSVILEPYTSIVLLRDVNPTND